MPKLFIDGHAGTTGLAIVSRLEAVAGIELIRLPDSERKSPKARLAAMASSDLTVLCLPDEAAREAVMLAASLGNRAPKLLDASTAHRTASGWVYGFAEMQPGWAAQIAAARLVANPGCYATGVIALLRPLTDGGLLSPSYPISINAISGYSGGGKAMIAAHQAADGPAFELYALGLAHKHIPEIMAYSGLASPPIFVPSVGHFAQGMLVSVPLFLHLLPGQPAAEDIFAIYQRHYRFSLRIRPRPAATETLDPQACNGTDMLEIFIHTHPGHGHAVLTARLDNLGKGAAGAAVQNIALMLGMADPLATVSQELLNA